MLSLCTYSIQQSSHDQGVLFLFFLSYSSCSTIPLLIRLSLLDLISSIYCSNASSCFYHTSSYSFLISFSCISSPFLIFILSQFSLSLCLYVQYSCLVPHDIYLVLGTRLVVTILHGMKRTGKRYGVVSLCMGTGMGSAAVYENPDYFTEDTVSQSRHLSNLKYPQSRL